MPADVRSIKAEVALLSRAVVAIPVASRAVVQRGALEVKKQMQAEAKGIAHAPGLPSAITYETKIAGGGLEFEVGPVEGGAGSLALLYYGNSKTGPVIKDPKFALEREADQITKRLSDLVERFG